MNKKRSQKRVKIVFRVWINIDDLFERSLAAWEDFKMNPQIKPLMMKSTSWDTYDKFVRVYKYSHDGACDSVIINLMK